jgi:hypothetical protein
MGKPKFTHDNREEKDTRHGSRWTDEEIHALALSETRNMPSHPVWIGGKCAVCGSIMRHGECQNCGSKRR